MRAAEGPETPIRLFYSYSHNDEGLRKKLEDHLAVLRWSGMISEWHDRNIDVGEEWAKEIDRNLSSADIILLLVSASFIASAYCWSVEVKKALERHEKGEAKVIPVILRPCVWDITPFAKLQAAPTDAKPVTSWSDPDAALCDVAGKIERAATDLRQQRRHAAEEAHHRAEEARKPEEAEAGQVAEQQQREALQRREQDEARRAVEAKAARVPKTARNNDARGQQRLKLIAAVVLSVAVGLIIVAAHLLQQGTTPKPEPQRPAETAPKEEKKPAVAAPAPAPTSTPKPEPQRPAETAPKEEKKPAVAAPTPAPAPTRRALKPLDTFTDCGECPEMVVIPGGTFMMGSPANEPERKPNDHSTG